MKCFVYSRQGEERSVNEDSALLKTYEQQNIMSFAVADGMGDLDFGNEVSRIAVMSAIQHIEKNLDIVDWSKVLKEALEFADSEIKNFCIENRCVSGVAISIGVICNNILTFSWQGNVRIYCGSSDRWSLLTEDHKIFVGRDGYRLSRCLKGRGLRDDVNIISMDIPAGCNIMVCTDGLYDGCDDIKTMADIIRGGSIPQLHIFKDDNTGILIEI